MTANTTLGFWVGGLLVLAGCGGAAELEIESEALVAAEDEMGTLSAELATSVPIGTTLRTTANLNLRTGPSTGYRVQTVIPLGAAVTTVNQSHPTNGWYNVRYNGLTGWSYGSYLRVVAAPVAAAVAGDPRGAAISRAMTGVGFSYWWGHGRWLSAGPTSSTRGYCSGACPSCGHSGSFGADCSGFAAKVWQVPSTNSDVSVDAHPYGTWSFDNEYHGWHDVSRSGLRKADALVYNADGAGHMFIYESGDGWGSMWAIEARGCAYGIVRNLRNVSTAYKAISRDGW